MRNATTLDDIKRLAQQKRYWLTDNRGVQRRIAEEFGVVPGFVSDIFWGHRSSRNGDIEARLAELGAPGFNLMRKMATLSQARDKED